MKSIRKIMSVLLILIMAVSLLPMGAAAAGNTVHIEGTTRSSSDVKPVLGFISLRYDVKLSVDVDLSTKTATGTFQRVNCVCEWDDTTYNDKYKMTEGEYHLSFFRQNNPDAAVQEQLVRALQGDSAPHAFKCKAEATPNKPAPGAFDNKYFVFLSQIEWLGEPFKLGCTNYEKGYWWYVNAVDIEAPPAGVTPNSSTMYSSKDPNQKATVEATKYDINVNNGSREFSPNKLYLNITTPAEAPREFTFGVDNYSFKNDINLFKAQASTAMGHIESSIPISRTLYGKLTKGRSKAQIGSLHSYLKNMKGACFGMSATASMFYSGQLKTKTYNAAKNTYSLPTPNKHANLRDLILYYQLMMTDRELNDSLNLLGQHGAPSMSEIVNTLSSELPDTPVVITFRRKDLSGSHSVLAYKMEDVSYQGYTKIEMLSSPSIARMPLR